MMKQAFLTIVVLCFCILQFSDASPAQSKPAAKPIVVEPHRFDRFFAESSAEYWGCVVLDYQSSLKKREANPLLRNQAGEISGVKYFALNGGIYAITVALQPRWPALANWTRRIFAAVHITVFGHNLTVKPYR
jgi:hypothetical protein